MPCAQSRLTTSVSSSPLYVYVISGIRDLASFQIRHLTDPLCCAIGNYAHKKKHTKGKQSEGTMTNTINHHQDGTSIGDTTSVEVAIEHRPTDEVSIVDYRYMYVSKLWI